MGFINGGVKEKSKIHALKESLGKCSYQDGATTIAIDGATGAPKINGLKKMGFTGVK